MHETRSKTKCPENSYPTFHFLRYVWSDVVTCEQGPLDGELGGDLVDDVVGEVARDQAGVLHQHEDRVWYLLQLTVRQV